MTRASIEPPMVSVSVGKTRYSHGLIQESGVFAVNILKEADRYSKAFWFPLREKYQ